MGMRHLEAAILAELRTVSGRRSLRQKDITEWTSGEIRPEPDETHFFLPELQINVAVKTAALGKAAGKGGKA